MVQRGVKEWKAPREPSLNVSQRQRVLQQLIHYAPQTSDAAGAW